MLKKNIYDSQVRQLNLADSQINHFNHIKNHQKRNSTECGQDIEDYAEQKLIHKHYKDQLDEGIRELEMKNQMEKQAKEQFQQNYRSHINSITGYCQKNGDLWKKKLQESRGRQDKRVDQLKQIVDKVEDPKNRLINQDKDTFFKFQLSYDKAIDQELRKNNSVIELQRKQKGRLKAMENILGLQQENSNKRHNPITNPSQFRVHKPYILKQFKKNEYRKAQQTKYDNAEKSSIRRLSEYQYQQNAVKQPPKHVEPSNYHSISATMPKRSEQEPLNLFPVSINSPSKQQYKLIRPFAQQ